MTAAELLADCHARDIILHPNGGQLDIDAPAGALTDDLLQALRDSKAELLAILATPAPPATTAPDPDPDPDLAAALATLTLADLAHYRARLSARRDAGEPAPGIEWRALVDVRIDRGHWPVAPTPTTAPRPRSAAPVAVEWPGAAADFVLLLTPDDVPHPPFRLNDWTEVRDAGKMLRWLRADITRGPGGPQALSGALQADLLELQRFALAAHE